FQAEDGIRDFHVTGVQTCALPISVACRRAQPRSRHAGAPDPIIVADMTTESAMKALILAPLLLLGACATQMGGTAAGIPEIPADATQAVRTEANGDVITEYRVGGQIRVVKVQPPRGPAYYLYDRD